MTTWTAWTCTLPKPAIAYVQRPISYTLCRARHRERLNEIVKLGICWSEYLSIENKSNGIYTWKVSEKWWCALTLHELKKREFCPNVTRLASPEKSSARTSGKTQMFYPPVITVNVKDCWPRAYAVRRRWGWRINFIRGCWSSLPYTRDISTRHDAVILIIECNKLK